MVGKPELSEAVGSVQVTSICVDPIGAMYVIAWGQPVITGGMVSCDATIKLKKKVGYCKYYIVQMKT